MTIRESLTYVWNRTTGRQRFAVFAIVALLLAVFVMAAVKSIGVWSEVRKYERQATIAKREAEDALKLAARIAKEKLELEKTLLEVEVKRDEKAKQAADAEIKTIDARTEYERALREQRGDNPSTEQLCVELAALGYVCQ